jgi:hypothetical protein
MDNMLMPGIVPNSSAFIQSSLREMREWVMEGLPADRPDWEADLRRRFVVRRQPDVPSQAQPQQASAPPPVIASSTPEVPRPSAPSARAEAMDVEIDEDDAVVPARAAETVHGAAVRQPEARRPAEAPRVFSASDGGVRRPAAGATGGIPPAVDNWEEVLPRVSSKPIRHLLHIVITRRQNHASESTLSNS